MDRLFGPRGEKIGNDAAVAQAGAIRQELEIGRMGMRVLALLLSEMKDRKTTIRPTRFARFQEKYPGSAVRFRREENGETIVFLSTREEIADAMLGEKPESGTLLEPDSAPAPVPGEATS